MHTINKLKLFFITNAPRIAICKKLKIVVLLFAFWLLLFGFNKAQVNLVPNPSFESYTACPTMLDQLNFSTGWSSYRGSPDYYNACNGNGGLGVPSNAVGYQNAYSGTGYAGFIAYDVGGLAREIIGRQLNQIMVIGQKYYVSIQVNLAELDANTKTYVACNKVGVRFSTVPAQGSDSPFPGTNPVTINNFAHVYSTPIISDTMSWTKIQGSFIADSNYKYIMIGNFFDDLNTDTIYRLNGARSYFFVDEICVSTSSLTCNVIENINETENIEDFKVFPNPTASFISVNNITDQEIVASFYNPFGKHIFTKKFCTDIKIDLSKYQEGIYYLRLESKKGIQTKKIIKQ